MVEEKKPMTAGKIILIVVGTIMLLGLGTCATCAVCVGNAAHQVAEDEKKREAQAIETLKQCAQVEVVEWRDVEAGLKENEARIAAQWKGNCVKISGVIDTINSDYKNEPVVVISSGERFGFRNCHCRPQQPDRALSLTKGKKITVWGIGGNEIIGSLTLDHCEW